MLDPQIDQVLEVAGQLLAKGWCQKVEARDESGSEVSVMESRATRFCITGALMRAVVKVTGTIDAPLFNKTKKVLRRTVRKETGRWSELERWNDRRKTTQAHVLEMIEKARKAVTADYGSQLNSL